LEAVLRPPLWGSFCGLPYKLKVWATIIVFMDRPRQVASHKAVTSHRTPHFAIWFWRIPQASIYESNLYFENAI